MFGFNKIKKLQKELEELEMKIIRNNNFNRFDLHELEGIACEIEYEKMIEADLVKEG